MHYAPPNSLIIVGLPLHENSPIMQSDAFHLVEGHDLGPFGDFFTSKKHLHMQASLLVGKQHKPFQSILSRSSSPRDSTNSLSPVAEKVELGPSFSSTTSVKRDD